MFAEIEAPFPSETASDVVSFADHVVLVTAVAEAAESTTAVPTATGPSLPAIPRRVTFRVERPLWSRLNAPALPETITGRWCGWVMVAGKRRPCATARTPWVFVGAQYVMPIALDRGTFAPIQPLAVFRVADGVVTLEEQDTPLARQLAKASADGVRDVFARAVPDPVAAQYANLSPRARLSAVIAATTAARSARSPAVR
jgi:hypothetical protein